MAKRKYLTPQKKDMFLRELEKCKSTKIPGWGVDQNLLPLLNRINKNPELATMTSKICYQPCEENRWTSYLQVAVTRKGWERLKEIEEELKSVVEQQNAQLEMIFQNGRSPDSLEGPTQKTGLMIIDDVPTYTAVERCMFFFSCGNAQTHFGFFETITTVLENLFN